MHHAGVKLTAKVKLLAAAQPSAARLATMTAANRCADRLSDRAFKTGIFAPFGLHALAYSEARGKFGLSSQAVVRAIAKVADAYQLDKKTKRTFRPTGAIAYDARLLTWHDGVISIWTTEGRQRMRFAAGAPQLELLQHQGGESDLIYRRGVF